MKNKPLEEYGKNISFYLEEFSKNNNENCNYIFVKDPFQCWYIINYKKILELLKSEIKKVKHKKLFFIGQSAGGCIIIL